MSGQYGDARLELLFDFDTLVKITDVSDILRRVQKLTPTKYLVIPDTDLIFPNDCNLDSNGLSYEAKAIIRPSLPGSSCHQIDRRIIDDCNPGEAYAITLVKPFLRINTELERSRIPRTDDSHGNIFVLGVGELEERIAMAKESFVINIRSSLGKGVVNIPIIDKIYSRIFPSSISF